jgi:hypothetical protein
VCVCVCVYVCVCVLTGSHIWSHREHKHEWDLLWAIQQASAVQELKIEWRELKSANGDKRSGEHKYSLGKE